MKTRFLKIIVCLLTISASAQHKHNGEIWVASYNLRMDTPRDSLNSWPHRKENVKALIRYHDFDIVGTQEGFSHQLEDLLELPGFTYFGAGRDDGKMAGEHSAIFYRKERFTLTDSGNFWLSETPEKPGKGWDATCCNRICSWVRLTDKHTGKSFYVFNVHFDHRGVIARRESGKLMVRKIREIAGNTPVICTGDFNSTPETEQIVGMGAVVQDSYTITETPPYGPVGTSNGFRFEAPMKHRIDYVFVSRHFKVSEYAVLTDAKDRRYPSDHQSVVARIRFAE